MPLIAAQCSESTKARFRALAEREGLSESALLRKMVDQVLAGNERPSDLERFGGIRRGYTGQLRLRLRRKEVTAIRALAKPAGQSAQGWVVAQLRHRLEGAVPFAKEELDAMHDAVREIGRVGRNLNTITRHLVRTGQFLAEELELGPLSKAVERIRREMIATLTRATHRSGTSE